MPSIHIKTADELISELESALIDKADFDQRTLVSIEKAVRDQLLWGIFFTPKNNSNSDKDGSSFAFSYNLIKLANEAVFAKTGSYPVFFAKDVLDKIKDKDIFVELEEGSSFYAEVSVTDTLSQIECVDGDCSSTITIAPTLPDGELVFSKIFNKDINYSNISDEQCELIDSYEDVRFSVMDDLFNEVVQLGGHGRWIQGGYNGKYIGQLNWEIGDEGSVFLFVQGDEIESWIDMY